MDSMNGILKEELSRLKEAEKSYRREIAKLPKGSFQEKKIKGIVYHYLVKSKASEIKYQYIGHWPSNKIEKIKKDMSLKKKYQAMLREVIKNKKRIMRIVRVRKRSV